MKKRKTFLAKVLAAAIAVTAVLPGAMTAQAATIVTTTSSENVETKDTWSPELKKGNIGGQITWHLKSGQNNNNANSDYSDATAPAVILDTSADMTFTEDVRKSFSVNLYPNGTIKNMRFGIMLKYVDSTHWAYLGYDQGRKDLYQQSPWFLEYKNNTTDYPEISGLADLQDNKYTKVEVIYTAADSLTVKVTPDGGEETSKTIDDDTVSGIGTALEGLETFAATAGEDGARVPILMGFKAGSYAETTGAQKEITDMNLKDLTVNDNSPSFNDFKWVTEREGQVFQAGDVVGGVDYTVLDASASEEAVTASDSSLTDFENGAISAVIRLRTDNQAFALAARSTETGAVKVGYNGTKWYYQVGSAEKQSVDSAAAPAANTDYTLSLTIEGGKLSANVIPVDAEEGTEATVLAKDVDVSSVTSGSVAFETAAGTELWVRNVSYTNKTTAEPTDLQAKYDDVMEKVGAENTENKYYSDKWSAYDTALKAAKEMIESDAEISQADADAKETALDNAYKALVPVDKKDLQAKYDELAAEEKGLWSDDSWTEFQGKLKEAKDVLDKIDKKESVASTEVNAALNTLKNAKNVLAERPATTEEKAGLQEAFDKAKDTENKCYTEASWTTFTNALAAAEEALKAENVNNTEVAEKLEALNAAFAGLTAQTAAAEDVQNMKASYDSAKATANDNYTKESWDAFQAALKNVEAVIAKGGDATQYEVQDVLKKLEDAKAALKKNAPVDNGNNNNNNNNNNNKPEAKIPAVGETTVLKGVTYKVTKSDAANGTVSVSRADKNTKKVTIPSTVTIGEVTFKVTAVDAKAFAGCKKLTSVTIGANVTSIGKQAFSKCTKLKKVIFKGTKAPKIGAKAFQKTAKKCVVTTPKKMAKKQLKKLKTSLKKAGMKSAVYKKK